MNKEKSIIRHEILNVLTMVNFGIMGLDADKEVKREILDQLKTITLLLSHEDVLLGAKRKILCRVIELDEVFEILQVTLEDQMEETGLSLPINTKALVKGDRTIFKEGLQQIIVFASSLSKKIKVTAVDKKGIVNIEYGGGKKLPNLRSDLFECLGVNRCPEGIGYQLALHMMNLAGVKFKFAEGHVEIKFPLA